MDIRRHLLIIEGEALYICHVYMGEERMSLSKYTMSIFPRAVFFKSQAMTHY